MIYRFIGKTDNKFWGDIAEPNGNCDIDVYINTISVYKYTVIC